MANSTTNRTTGKLSSAGKPPGGRPEKFSPDLQTRFCQLIRSGQSIKEACQDVGITTTAFVQWRKKGREESVLPEEQWTKYYQFYIEYLAAEKINKELKEERKRQKKELAQKRRSELNRNVVISRLKQQQKKGNFSKKKRILFPNLDARSLTSRTLYDTTILENPFIAGTIFPMDLQMKFLRLADFGLKSPTIPIEAFLSGASSSGKTTALLLAALQFVRIPEYKALLLRASPSMGMLPAKMRQMLGSSCELIKITPVPEGLEAWQFPSGAEIIFGYINDTLKTSIYTKFRWHFIGFDELTHFPETDYLFSFDALWSVTENRIPLRIFSNGCPDGPYRDWIKKRFIHCPHDELIKNNRRVLHVSIDDNMYVRKEEIEPACRLLDPITQQRLLIDNWDI
jgi:hypothetical protein